MDCEPVQVCRTETPVARGMHRCSHCDGWIRRGERYTLHHTLFEGQWRDYAECDECEAMAARLNAEMSQDGVVPLGMLADEIMESESRPDALAMLATMRRRGARAATVRRFARVVEHMETTHA